MASIPIYALYGEDDYASDANWLHWETITSRSRLYGFRIAPHRHEQFFQILFLTKGSAKAIVDGESVALSPPALVTIPALSVHGYTFSEDVEGLVVTLFARDVRALIDEIGELGDVFERPVVIAGDLEGALDDAIRALIAEADAVGPGQSAAVRARLSLLLIAIFRQSVASARRGSGQPDRAEQLARAFQALVESDYRDTRAVPHYAEKLAITPTHLNRICRQVLGTSALSVIERRIVLEARRYLQFSSLSVKEIGIVLGYPDPAYFSRFFARAAGVTPSEFRARVA